jgi:CheY-like chemotaxis protein
MTHHLIALAGFATREHAAIESAFGTAALKRLNCRVTNQLGAAALVIADGDNAAVIRLLRARPAGQQVLLIGNSDGGSGWPILARRFKMADLVAALTTGLAAAQPVSTVAAPRATTVRPSPVAFAATEPFAPLAQESLAPTRPAIRRAFAATEPFAPLVPVEAPAASPDKARREAPGFAATEPFAPLAGEGTSFAATEPFAPLSNGQAATGGRRSQKESRSVARDDAITPESMAAFKRAQARAPAGQTDFMGIAAPSGFGETPQVASAQVLVVDDSEIGLRLMHRHLLELGAGVKFARSGAEALQSVATERFSHVFVDSMMTGMAGLKTCRAIKSLPLPDGHMPRIVLVTNLGGSSDRSKGMLAGCDAYLLKPFRIDDLRTAMDTPATGA